MAPGGVLLFHAAVVVFLLVAGGASGAAGRVFTVGDAARGWRQPVANDETYNHWAARNRFYVGDFLDFKYTQNDSVLVVSRGDYKLCNGDNPELRFDGGGDANFRLDRNGDFFFISGAPGHCNAGQRMNVRVMAEHGGDNDDKGAAPAPAPSPGDDEDDSGGSFRPGGSAGTKPGAGGPGSVPAPPQRGRTSGAAASMHPAAPSRGYHAALAVVLLVLA